MLADLSRAIELEPEDAWSLAVRGATYSEMGSYEAKLADLSRAIELKPDDEFALASAGRPTGGRAATKSACRPEPGGSS